MRRRTSFVIAATVALALLAASCGGSSGSSSPSKSTSSSTSRGASVDPNAPEVVAPGDIPDNQVFVAFAVPAGGYSLSVPEGWARSDDNTTTTFTDHYNRVSVSATDVPTAPTAASAKADQVPALQRDVPNFQLVQVTTVNRTAGPAVVVSYRAGSAPDPVTGKRVALDVERYEFWRAGRQVTLTLSGARGSDNVDPWKTVTNSFAWTP